jgi:hypothetical protein
MVGAKIVGARIAGTQTFNARTTVRAYNPDSLNQQAHTVRRVHLPPYVQNLNESLVSAMP